MIYVNAAIGLGKTSLTTILSDFLNTKAFYERVDDMPMLKKFYSAGADSRLSLAFPLQVAFLNYRYNQLRQGLYLQEHEGMRNTIYDSSLLSDNLMAGNLYRRGEFPQEEYDLYLELSKSMQSNVSGHPFNGYPDLVIFLHGKFDTMLEQIQNRGRDMESIKSDPALVDYYRSVWETYEAWGKSYAQSAMVDIDMDEVDFVGNFNDRVKVLQKVLDKMYSIRLINDKVYNERSAYLQNGYSLEFAS